MKDIVVQFVGSGVREEAFATIDGAVQRLIKLGYTLPSGGGFYDISVSTRLYKSNGSGAYARTNTTSTPNTWLTIVEQVQNSTLRPL